MEPNSTKTIYRYDSRGSGFKKAAYLLLTLALLLAIFGICQVKFTSVKKYLAIDYQLLLVHFRQYFDYSATKIY